MFQLRFILIFFQIGLCIRFLNAQSYNYSNKKLQHQLEVGINYTKFLGNRNDFEGLGSLGIYLRDFDLDHFLDYPKNYYLYNYYLSYKAIVIEKHIIKFDIFRNLLSSNKSSVSNSQMVSSIFDVKSLGYGYLIKNKNIKTSFFGQLSYRIGSEMVLIDKTSIYDFDNYAFINYNDFGFSAGVDLEYFFTKNFGLGANIYYYNYPFEKNKLSGSNVEIRNPELVNTYKPVSDFLNVNIKIAYLFSLPNFGKKAKNKG